MLQCFISYSRKDTYSAETLARSLRDHHYEVWIDAQGIQGGDDWEKKIHQAIAKSDVCLVILTPDSVESEWVKREIEAARQVSNPIIPLHMRQIKMPGDLERLSIADVQYIDFVRYGRDEGELKLLHTLEDLQTRSTEPQRLRALIIEDDPSQQTHVKSVLSSQDIETLIAGDLDGALDFVRNPNEHFDLITLDMQLDNLDVGGQHGRNLLDQIQMWRPNTPVIIISALEFKGDEVRDFLREDHAFDILKKPFKPKKLREVVEEALGRKKG